jgi:hypothetical protein
MSTHELARKLLEGPDLPAHFAYLYGDHWRTTVAPEISAVNDGTVVYSAYHSMDKLIEDEQEHKKKYGDDEDKYRKVIIIS